MKAAGPSPLRSCVLGTMAFSSGQLPRQSHLPANPAKKPSVLALTSRETEVAHLVGQGLSNPEIAAELFISRKAVEYHLGNIYAKYGLQGRQQLRRMVAQWREPTSV